MPKILIFVAFKLVILVRNIEHFCHGRLERSTGCPRRLFTYIYCNFERQERPGYKGEIA